MKSILLLMILFIAYDQLTAQTKLENLTITPLGSGDSINLDYLKTAIGDSKIVLLGEQTHFDGATLKSKIEIVKYLHENLGFDVLAFEAGMYSMDKASREIDINKQSVKDVLSLDNFPSYLMGIYLKSQEFNELLSYLGGNKNLKIAGFDCQITGNYSMEYLIPELKNFIEDNDQKYLNESEYFFFEEVLSELMNGDFKTFNQNGIDSIRFKQLTSKIYQHVNKSLSKNSERISFWLQFIESVNACVDYFYEESKGVKFEVQNPRDLQMASNLIALSKRWPDKKIIAWGASYHFAYDLGSVDFKNDTTNQYLKRMNDLQHGEQDELSTFSELLEGGIPMGKRLKEYFGKQIYSIGFTSYHGHYGIKNDTTWLFPIQIPPTNSIEAKLSRLPDDYLFVDYAHSKNRSNFYSSPLGYLPIKANWGEIFDGMFYIKEMLPLSPNMKENFKKYKQVEVESNGKVKGQIIDIESNKPIPYAHIKLDNTSIGTTSNNYGFFDIVVGNKKEIIISSIGYNTLVVRVDDFFEKNMKIKMSPQIYILEEVIISAPITEETIIKKAFENIGNNYVQHPYSLDIFYRNVKKRDTLVQLLEEAALKFYDSEGYKRETWSKIINRKFLEVIQLRKSIQTQKTIKTSLNEIWAIWTTDPVLTPDNILSPGRIANYEIEPNEVRYYQNKLVYELKFKCKKPNAYNTPYAYPSPSSYEGTILIDSENFAILKYEALTNWESVHYKKKRLIKAFKLNSPFTLTKKSHDLYYYDRYGENYLLRYAKRTFSYNINPDNSEQTIVQIDDREIVNTNVELINPIPISQSLLEVDTNIPYNKVFWESFNIKINDYINE
jgi:erythromycin esterase-like protein